MNRRRPPRIGDPVTTPDNDAATIGQPATPGKDRSLDNQRRIEAAALALFTTQGFHGTNNREIADRAGLSTAAIYTYYSSKEAIFDDLAQKYRARMTAWFEETVAGLTDPFSKRDLRAFASAILAKLGEDRDGLLLVLIDVTEFKNRHFADFFHEMPERLRRLLRPALSEVVQRPTWRGHDPAFVLAAVYNYFFHCALIENHMQGERHLGVSSELAIRRFVDLLAGGLLSQPTKPKTRYRPTPRSLARKRALDQAARDRIEFIRLLCGRLWNPPPEILTRLSGKQAEPAARVPILFLPETARDRPDENQLHIETAALELFTTQGFHGTHIRDIAEKAELSQGTIYTYYAKKETIFEELARSYQICMVRFTRRIIMALDDPLSNDNLRLLAWTVRSMVYDDAQYVLLMFVDVLEFKNQHFADLFRDVPSQFRHLLGPELDRVKTRPGWCGLDPAFVLATIYLFFFNYFVIERHMRGNQHLGAPEEEAIERLIDMFSAGLWTQAPNAAERPQRLAAGDVAD
ncbi:MAG TPA: TetR/AcrR family transcriptional regulator [Aliidongia sp.]|nr:TetR/AcrR family transcriptional regulator [Aliidongia sp.]